MTAHRLGDQRGARRPRSTGSSARASSSPAASSPSRTARTTPRRRWGSSRSRSSPPGELDEDFTRPPTWVIVSAAFAMSAGTYAGGWRIIRTLGTRIAKIDPPQGFSAQTSCASMLWTTAHLGFPVSTTHVISGSVMGAGATRGLHAVRWGVAGNIVTAWIFTIPMAGLVGAGMELITRLPGGDVIVFGARDRDLWTAFAHDAGRRDGCCRPRRSRAPRSDTSAAAARAGRPKTGDPPNAGGAARLPERAAGRPDRMLFPIPRSLSGRHECRTAAAAWSSVRER